MKKYYRPRPICTKNITSKTEIREIKTSHRPNRDQKYIFFSDIREKILLSMKTILSDIREKSYFIHENEFFMIFVKKKIILSIKTNFL